MHRIVVRAEAADHHEVRADGYHRRSHSHAISHAAWSLTEDLDVAAIAAFTRTGRTAHLLSRERPHVPIYAFTRSPAVYRRLALWWGVTPAMAQLAAHSEDLIEQMEGSLLERNAVAPGDLLVIVGALPFREGVHTNFIKLHTARRLSHAG
jgi:pyruvate kinase